MTAANNISLLSIAGSGMVHSVQRPADAGGWKGGGRQASDNYRCQTLYSCSSTGMGLFRCFSNVSLLIL